MTPWDAQYRLRRQAWEVRDVDLATMQDLVTRFHYAGGGSNTRTYGHGLFMRGLDFCWGVAWWIPPTKSAAKATYPQNWEGILCLSRLVLIPDLPKNAASFLLSQSRKAIDRTRWPALVTYADEWRGHTGAIYRSDNWDYVGRTTPEATWVLNGRMVSRKAGPVTRTRAEMEALGAVMVGRYAKHKFVRLAR